MAIQPQAGDWVPNAGAQTQFLQCAAFEVLFGGAAGGSKTCSLVVDATRYIGLGHGAAYQAVIFRRTFEDLKKTVLLETHMVYPRLGGRYNAQDHCWLFPGAERIWLGYLDNDSDVLHWQGTQVPFVGFDEVTQFTQYQYLYLFSRVRSVRGIPGRVRAATNPGGPGNDWVFKRWQQWLDPTASFHADPGQTLYFAVDVDGNERQVDRYHVNENGERDALGRCFIPAKLSDNPHLSRDTQYALRLDRLDPVTRAQLKDGNWLIKPGRGLLFKRHWFEVVEHRPVKARWIRYWDLAATEDGGDWTVGLLMAIADDGIYVVDVVRLQGSPGTVEATILQTAGLDGRDVMIGLPQDPGQAGVAQCAAFKKLLMGYNVRFNRETGDKVERAKPFSAQAEPRGGSQYGRVKLVRGEWNLSYVQEHEAFPDQKAKDQVDASSGAFTMLNGKASSSDVAANFFDDFKIGNCGYRV